MGLEILTVQLVPSPAVEALAAELRVVCADSVANLKAFPDRVGAERCDLADGLVAGNQGETGDEFAIVCGVW